jgi:F-type H+-transporting ATPase subunit c
MDVQTAAQFVLAAKAIGAGLATIALFGVGIGIGNVFATLISTVGRNPSVQQRVFPFAIIGFALVEAVGLFALLIAFLVLFT